MSLDVKGTGLRCSELFALKWCDVLWDDLTLLVRRGIVSGRTLLDETGAPMKVQQELMRHADIRATMNVYGKAMDESKREAHCKVVRIVCLQEWLRAP